jgi:hypothetical protein
MSGATNVYTNRKIMSVIYQELQNIYLKCHNHRRVCKRILSINVCLSANTITDKLNDRQRKFQRVGINASLIACFY